MLQDNLDRLLAELTPYKRTKGGHSRQARSIATQVPLAHSTSFDGFQEIIRSGRLLSPENLAASSRRSEDTPELRTEEILGTERFVFLFAGPFRFGSSNCGFLFRAELETGGDLEGEASPFDSGGLIKVFSGIEGRPKDFLDRHRLPLVGHRKYLEGKLSAFFDQPIGYVEPIPPDSLHDPVVGLGGGDARRWTHEVRFKDQLDLHDALEAVFYRKRNIGTDLVTDFLIECRGRGVYIEAFEASREQEYDVLLRCCCEFIKGKLEP